MCCPLYDKKCLSQGLCIVEILKSSKSFKMYIDMIPRYEVNDKAVSLISVNDYEANCR